MKQNYMYNAAVAVSGGIFGLILYFAMLHLGDKIPAAAQIKWFPLMLSVLLCSILSTFVWTGTAVLFFKTFKEDLDKDFRSCAFIVSVPSAIILAVPVLLSFYEKLKAAAPTMLGYIYLPFKGYTHVTMAGYALLLMLGFMWIVPLFLFALKFIKDLYDTDKYFTRKQKAALIFKAALLFFFLTGAYVTLIYPPTGDEPHFLLISQSIYEDRDVNLENNYATEKKYADFYPAFLEYENIHNTTGKGGAGIYSQHSPGLPAIIWPFYKIGGRYGTQFAINIFTALFISMLFVFIDGFTGAWKGSAALALFSGLSLPVGAMSSLVLTEMPSALMILYSIYFLYFYDKSKNSLPLFLCMSALPWFHSKLSVFTMVLFIWYYFAVFKNRAFSLKKEAANLAVPAVFGGAFILFYYMIYGAFAPFAVTSIYVNSSFYFIFDAAHSLKAFFAIFFDRDYGIITYNVFLIVCVWGMLLAVKKAEYKKLLPLAAVAPYFSMFLLWNDWTGSMTPARQMTPLIGVFILYAGYFMKETGFEKTKLFKFLFFAGAVVSCILFWLPFLRYAATKDKIYAALGKAGGYFLWLLPSFRDKINPQHLIMIFYAALIIFLFYKYGARGAIKKEK